MFVGWMVCIQNGSLALKSEKHNAHCLHPSSRSRFLPAVLVNIPWNVLQMSASAQSASRRTLFSKLMRGRLSAALFITLIAGAPTYVASGRAGGFQVSPTAFSCEIIALHFGFHSVPLISHERDPDSFTNENVFHFGLIYCFYSSHIL